MSINAETGRYSGIAGLRPKEPIGAVLSIGRKTKDGKRIEPGSNDRFWLVLPDAAAGVRDLHPSFAAFNGLPADKRQSVRGMLVHVTRAECFEHHLTAQRLPRHESHPNDISTCTGDGTRATRWVGGQFRSITCPNQECEFRQGDAPLCKPFMRVLFRIEWPKDNPLPRPLVKLTSRSWNSTASFLGLFGEVDRRATALGLTTYSLAGLRLLITLSRKTSRRDGGRAFPVLRPSLDCDLEEFLYAQHQRFQTIEAAPAAALTDREQVAPNMVSADYWTVTPGVTPGLPDNREPSVPVGEDAPPSGREPGEEG